MARDAAVILCDSPVEEIGVRGNRASEAPEFDTRASGVRKERLLAQFVSAYMGNPDHELREAAFQLCYETEG